MKSILDRLREGELLICDGALGTLLQERGLQGGECPELWCVDRPHEVEAIHRLYRDAGSDIVECNSFGGTRYKLAHYGMDARAAELNRAAAALARRVAGDRQHVMGSIGPTGQFLEPLGTETEEAFYDAFKTQAVALEAGGADCAIIETMTALEEAACAVRAVRENTRMTVLASFTFDPQANGGYATMMGVTPERFATAMAEAGVNILGSNCGIGTDHMIRVVASIKAANTGLPVIAMPNAGMPVLENGVTVFKETPEQMAAKVPALIAAGANIIGGCCGTTPEHIAAMRKAAVAM